jgi:hypothetical protein
MLGKKLKVWLLAHLNKIAHMFEIACDRANCDDDFPQLLNTVNTSCLNI